MKNNYQAVLFAPDGDYVTDFNDRAAKQDVWNELAEMGSRWIFYPLGFVATGKTIVDTPDGMEQLKGKRIKTVKRIIKDNEAQICEAINNDWPLYHIF